MLKNITWRISEGLNATRNLQNVFQYTQNETQSISAGLLNSDSRGMSFTTETLYGSTPKLKWQYITTLSSDDIFTYNPLNKTLDLGNDTKIINSPDPVNTQDLVTKQYLDTSIANFKTGTVTSVQVQSGGSGLSVNNGTITEAGTITLNLSSKLQSIENLTTTGVAYYDNTNTSFKTIQLQSGSSSFNVSTGQNAITLDVSSKIKSVDSLATTGVAYYDSVSSTLKTINMGTTGQGLVMTGANTAAFADLNYLKNFIISPVSNSGIVVQSAPSNPLEPAITIDLSPTLKSLNNMSGRGVIVKNTIGSTNYSTVGSTTVGNVLQVINTSGDMEFRPLSSAGGGTGDVSSQINSGSTNANYIPAFSNDTGKIIYRSQLSLDSDTVNLQSILKLNGTRVTGGLAPINDADLTTKKWVTDLIKTNFNGFINAFLGDFLRIGTVTVGDISGAPTGSLTTAGAITSATKTNPQGGASYLTINFVDKGFAPLPIISIRDTQSGNPLVLNDFVWAVYGSVTNTQLQIVIEETSSQLQNIVFTVLLFNTSINFTPG